MLRVQTVLALYGLKVLRRIIESFEPTLGPLYAVVTLDNLQVLTLSHSVAVSSSHHLTVTVTLSISLLHSHIIKIYLP